MCAFDRGVYMCLCVDVCVALTRLCKYISTVCVCVGMVFTNSYICICVSNYKVHLFVIVREWCAVTSYLTHRE